MFRRARSDEAERLREMTLDGIRHWGHHVRFPELFETMADSLSTAEEIGQNSVYILEEDGEMVGFYELKDREDHVELLRMFLDVDRIGHGYGRLLWGHAVVEAATISHRMRILSDPEAVGFYAAMGATLERMHEVAPGFSLGVFWYDLESTHS
jgi:GNAT superfamily N-acetyltransferase